MPHAHPLSVFLPCALALALLTAWPARAAEPRPGASTAAASTAAGDPAAPRPAVREAATPRRTPAIVLPSVEAMRAAAQAETPHARADVTSAPAAPAVAPAADARPPVAVPAVVLPAAAPTADERRRAPSRGFLPPLPVTVRPAAQPAVEPAVAAPVAVVPAVAAAVTTPSPVAEAAPAPPAPTPTPTAAPSPAAPAAPAPTPSAPVPTPPPDANSPDPLERLRARLAERLAAVKPPDADSPYELQISTRAAAQRGPAAGRGAGGNGGAASKKAAARAAGKPLGEGEWAYAGDKGPQAWGGLCASGQRQSPIDIRGGLPVALEPIGFHYQSGAFSVLDTGHTVQVNVAPGNYAQLGDRRFELQQFHFHRPSEETLDGRRFDLSVHLVHRDAQGRRLVVAVLVQQGSAQPVLRSVFGNLPLEQRQENPARTTLNPAELLPGEQAYYTYMGSLTTPPCSEDVQWVVLRHPVAASAEQIDLFGRLYTDNIRPLQQAEGRRILQTR